jgi:xylulose-5-phosphate/fructose-6-phosphate phosphoketolase
MTLPGGGMPLIEWPAGGLDRGPMRVPPGDPDMTTTAVRSVLTDADARTLDSYWRAANCLSAGQIYLLDNPLLTEPLRPEHIKPRLLGHWGTTPGLNFIWAHLDRLITTRNLDMMFVIGPGHGGPAALANTWLEGSYTEVYPGVARDGDGMQRLFRQFSFPGGVPSHVAPQTPGSIHEGGEPARTSRSPARRARRSAVTAPEQTAGGSST